MYTIEWYEDPLFYSELVPVAGLVLLLVALIALAAENMTTKLYGNYFFQSRSNVGLIIWWWLIRRDPVFCLFKMFRQQKQQKQPQLESIQNAKILRQQIELFKREYSHILDSYDAQIVDRFLISVRYTSPYMERYLEYKRQEEKRIIYVRFKR